MLYTAYRIQFITLLLLLHTRRKEPEWTRGRGGRGYNEPDEQDAESARNPDHTMPTDNPEDIHAQDEDRSDS